MEMARMLLLLLCGLASVIVAKSDSSVSCEDLGFTGLALCSDCDALAEIVKDAELESDCRKCCAQELQDSISKTYSGAILEVCMRKLVFYRNVEAFIEKSLAQFPLVDVNYRFGSSPKLIMKDERGNEKESIRIDNWKTEHIEQFLKEKVRPKAT
ncbi:hypothetical protein O6H91_11G046300 [Diphasiastrum complanatum]|uniref:Uncharacterized protein n=1 Tax=Diphasiastrum complanatum TaxID=34168 RepID=A0ACC2C8R6_DIPCM|nr:hypothetical protein O6H91_11G046300 [Diphasiastrum complanatum]